MFEFLIEDSFIEKNDRIAVGVSGGADSMLLLWGLIDKQKQTGFYMEVVHVNHHLRGMESDSDSKFVAKFCKKYKLPVQIIDIDVKKLKETDKRTIEECARLARYEAFESVMKKNKLNKLFLAHHKNDQAETILMHIFRGSGIGGASGIKSTDKIKRPLLHLSKEEILKLCNEYGIEFVQDASNAENDYSRNYLRNVVLPQVEEIYPGVVNNLVKFGKRCEEIYEYLLEQIDESLIELNADGVMLNQKIFEQKLFLVREYFKKAFENMGIFSDIESKHYAMLYELSKAEVNKEISLPHGLFARKSYGGIKILHVGKKDKLNLEFEFIKNGEILFGNYCKIKTKTVDSSEVVYGEGLFVDASKISNNAVWRTRRIGDKFAKIGTGSKKFNDYLTNSKVDHEIRDRMPILANGDNVLVVAGDDVSENVKLDAGTDEIVKITFETI